MLPSLRPLEVSTKHQPATASSAGALAPWRPIAPARGKTIGSRWSQTNSLRTRPCSAVKGLRVASWPVVAAPPPQDAHPSLVADSGAAAGVELQTENVPVWLRGRLVRGSAPGSSAEDAADAAAAVVPRQPASPVVAVVFSRPQFVVVFPLLELFCLADRSSLVVSRPCSPPPGPTPCLDRARTRHRAPNPLAGPSGTRRPNDHGHRRP